MITIPNARRVRWGKPTRQKKARSVGKIIARLEDLRRSRPEAVALLKVISRVS